MRCSLERELRPNITYQENPTSRVFWILFEDPLVVDFCMNLSLLKFDLVESVVLISDKQLKIKKGKKLKNARGKVAVNIEGFEIIIPEEEIDYWLSFFLAYYRDGVGDVDHIDLDIPYDNKGLGLLSFQLALQVKNKRPLQPLPKKLILE